MGDEVNVQLSRVDEKLGHIEFELVEQKTSRSRHLAKPRRPSSSEVEKAGKRRKGLQTKRSSKQGRTQVSQDGPEKRDEKTDRSRAAPRKSRAKQSQAAQRPAKRSGAKQGKKSPQNSRVVEQGVTKKADAKKGSKQSVDNPVKASKRPPPKRSSSKGASPKSPLPKSEGEPLTADRSSTRKPFKRRISKGKTK